MKIDIHTHTKKCKSGDAATREISPKSFCETVQSTEVGIIAITNHNVFDLQQFREIEELLGDAVQVWPGIELDIVGGGSRGHLIVIVSPKIADTFSLAVNELTKGSTPDQFTASIQQVLGSFETLDPLYIAHYKQKRPAIPDEVLQVLETQTKRPECVIKEVTNSISAGISISHGRSSIYGSDVHDWAEYVEKARTLPDLRLPVNSFEHFCLLLKKDVATINTLLDRKTAEELTIRPFGDGTTLKIQAFNDINVIFGSKGTGKTRILEAIAKHYSDSGVEAKVYSSASDRLDEIFDVKGKTLAINLNPLKINYCTDEIALLRAANEVSVTSLEKYVNFFQVASTNANAKKILLKDIDLEDEASPRREFGAIRNAGVKTQEFLNFLATSPEIVKYLPDNELAEVTRILGGLQGRLFGGAWTSYSSWKEIALLNAAIKLFSKEIERKTGKPAKPLSTGFRDYATNRLNIEVSASKVLESLAVDIPSQTEIIGSLGSGKDDLQFVTQFRFQNGTLTDSKYSTLTGVKKGPQKKFAMCIRQIKAHVYADDLFQKITELNEIEDGESIKTVYELILFVRFFALDGLPYLPSSGESSMVMLQKELGADKDVYILDEPERSLGNEYISDVIVPLIKERARLGRKIFISTHDANIAVRTLPYSSVYRCYGRSGYKTYAGNPFSNFLVNLNESNDRLDWKKISMKTLEGGEEAFGERGSIYGSH